MDTNNKIKNLANIAENQSKLINDLINLSSQQLKKIELLLKEKSVDTTDIKDTPKEREKARDLIKNLNKRYIESESSSDDIYNCDYIIYTDTNTNEKIIGKVIEDGNENYQLFNPILNSAEYSCYGSVNELIEDYIEESELIIFKASSYTNMIPDKSNSYILYIENPDEKDIKEVVLFEDENSISLIDDKGNVLSEGNSYEDLIFRTMLNYRLVIPIEKYYDTTFL